MGHQPDGVDQARLRAALNRYLLARTAPGSDEQHAARLELVEVLRTAGREPPTAVRAAVQVDRPFDAQEQHRSRRRSA